MAPNHPSSTDSDDNEQTQNDVVQEEQVSVVKRKLTVDEPKSTRKRAARVSYADSSVIRIWSQEDEIALLDGLIEYGQDPHYDYKAFFEFVQDSIQTNVSMKQFRDKIIKLKHKYLLNVGKGDDLVFGKPHDEKLFDLSKKIWGGESESEAEDEAEDDDVIRDEVEGGESEAEDREIEKVEDDDDVIRDEVEGGDEGVVREEEEEERKNEGLGFKEMYPYLSEVWESDGDFPKTLKDMSVRKMIGCEKTKALDKECKRVFVDELRLYVEKLDWKTKLAKVALDQIGS